MIFKHHILTRLIALLFMHGLGNVALGQTVSDMTQIHAGEDFETGSFEILSVVSNDMYHYMLLKTKEGLIQQDETELIDSDNLILGTSSLVVLKMDEANNVQSSITLSITDQEGSLSNGFFESHNLYIDEDMVYIFGNSRYADSMYINGTFHKEINVGETFILGFNEALGLENEYYFAGEEVFSRLPKLIIQDKKLLLAGVFYSRVRDALDYKMIVFNDTIWNLERNYPVETAFFLEYDMATESVVRSFTFGGIFYNRIFDLAIDNEQNVYIACDEGAGHFEVLGEGVKQNTFAATNAVTFSFDENTNLNYLTHYESTGNDNQHFFYIDKMDLVYESSYSGGGDTLFINDEKVILGADGSSQIIKRNATGKIIWISRLATPNTNNKVSTIAELDNGNLLAGCRIRKDEVFFNDEYLLSGTGFSEVLILEIDHLTGELVNHYVSSSSPVDLSNDIHSITFNDKDLATVVLTIGDWAADKDENTISILDQAIKPVSQSSKLVLNVDFKNTFVEDLPSYGLGISPNPLRLGQTIGCDTDIEIEIYDSLGRRGWKGNCGDHVFGLNEGVHFVKTIDEIYNYSAIIISK